MPQISCLQFSKSPDEYLKSPVLYFFGDEDFLIERSIEKLLAAALGKINDFNLVRIYGDEAQVGEIISACETFAFGCPRKVVLVKRADELSAADLEAFLGYLEKPSDSTLLVFWGGDKIDLRRKFFKLIEKKNLLVKAEKPKAEELSGYARAFAKRRGNPLEDDAADVLVLLTGSSLSAVDQAVERLSLFVGEGKPITREAARFALADTREGILWSLTDALASRDLMSAFAALKRILREKETSSPVLVVATLAGFFRRLLYIQTAQAMRLSDAELTRLTGLSPGALYHNKNTARRFTAGELKRALAVLHDADKTLKSSSLPHTVVLQETLSRVLTRA